MGIVFFLSRLFYFFLGIRFYVNLDASQFIDTELLKSNLFQSIYYLHIQPPLFNLFLGVVLKLFPGKYAEVFHFIYLVMGLLLAISIFATMTRLGVSGKQSFLWTLLFIVSPACILYENHLSYEYPVAMLLCLSALFLHQFLSHVRLRDGFIFFALLAFIVLIRSLFHFIWFVVFVLCILYIHRQRWRKIAVILCVPLLIVTFWYSKNLYLFGSFTSSTWFGSSLFKIATHRLSEEEWKLLQNNGKISGLTWTELFNDNVILHTYIHTYIPIFLY